jgi:hypothetical protein
MLKTLLIESGLVLVVPRSEPSFVGGSHSFLFIVVVKKSRVGSDSHHHGQS